MKLFLYDNQKLQSTLQYWKADFEYLRTNMLEESKGLTRIPVNSMQFYKYVFKGMDKEAHKMFMEMCIHKLLSPKPNQVSYYSHEWYFYRGFISTLLRSVDLNEQELANLCSYLGENKPYSGSFFPYTPLLSSVDKVLQPPFKTGQWEAWKTRLENMRFKELIYGGRDVNKLIKDIIERKERGDAGEVEEVHEYNTDVVKGAVFEEYQLKNLQKDWEELVKLLSQNAKSSKPTKKWIKAFTEFLKKIDIVEYKRLAKGMMEGISEQANAMQKRRFNVKRNPFLLDEVVCRNVVWSVSLIDDDTLNSTLKEMTFSCFKKIKNIGAFNSKLGNAALWSFMNLPFNNNVKYLAIFKNKLKYPKVSVGMVQKYLTKIAEDQNKPLEDLLEIAVPDYDLNFDRILTETIGDYSYEIAINEKYKTTLIWKDAKGKTLKSVPSRIKTNHKEALKAIKQNKKDIEETLQAEIARLEKSYLLERTWLYEEWDAIYLEHPLLSLLMEHLIWFFEKEDKKTAALFVDGSWINLKGEKVQWFDETTTVSLWHPLQSNLVEQSEWQDLFKAHQKQNPFPQINRRIYKPKEAEDTFNKISYFNKRVVNQFSFLMNTRKYGWNYTVMGNFDSHNIPNKTFQNLHLKIFVQPYEEDKDNTLSNTGLYNEIVIEGINIETSKGEYLKTADVSPIKYSELMYEIERVCGR